MKGLYYDQLYDVNKVNGFYQVQTQYGSFCVRENEVIVVPEEVYAPRLKELDELENQIKLGNEKKQKIRERYIEVLEEVDKAITKVKASKMLIIQKIKEQSIQAQSNEQKG